MMLLAQGSADGISWQDGTQGPGLTAGLLTKGDGRPTTNSPVLTAGAGFNHWHSEAGVFEGAGSPN